MRQVTLVTLCSLVSLATCQFPASSNKSSSILNPNTIMQSLTNLSQIDLTDPAALAGLAQINTSSLLPAELTNLVNSLVNETVQAVGGLQSMIDGAFASAQPAFTIDELLQDCDNDFSSEYRCPKLINSKPNMVNISFVLNGFGSINDKEETLETFGTLIMTWEVNNCRIDNLKIAPLPARIPIFNGSKIWKPPILLANSVDDPQLKSNFISDTFEAVFLPEGSSLGSISLTPLLPPFLSKVRFIWTRRGKFTTSCRLDLLNFPNDIQECGLVFELKEITKFVEFNSKPGESKIYLPPSMSSNNELILRNAAVNITTYDSELMKSILELGGGQTYEVSQAYFLFKLERLPMYYLLSLIIPCLVLAVVELGIFCFTNTTAERSAFSITLMLTFSFIQGDFISTMPRTPSSFYMRDFLFAVYVLTGACKLLFFSSLCVTCCL